MKNINKILICLAISSSLVGLSSCELDEYNPGDTSADLVWSTPENFNTLINSSYDYLRFFYTRVDGIFFTESGTDIWFNERKQTYFRQLSKYETLTSEVNQLNTNWREFYKSINHCNAGIERVGNVDWPSTEIRNQKEAELRFLRGVYYWIIVETWGNVVLRTAEVKEPEFTAQRSSIEDFYELIISDLQFATEHLPYSQGAEYGKASKKAAYGFLARAALSRAYYGGNEDHYLTIARDAAKEVIENPGQFNVELYPDYNDVWKPENNKNNKEALWSVAVSQTQSNNYRNQNPEMHSFFLAKYTSVFGGAPLVLSVEYGRDNSARLMPTKALLDFYDKEKDARFSANFQTVWLANTSHTWSSLNQERYTAHTNLQEGATINVGDTIVAISMTPVADKSSRPYITYDINDIYESNGEIKVTDVGGTDPFILWPGLKKFMDPTRTAANSALGLQDVMIMRFAELYLLAAEAEHQLGNNDQAAYYVNFLRRRAAKKIPTDYSSQMEVTAGDISLDFILNERARELCGEHIRWFDLKRTRTLGTRIQQHNPDIVDFQEFHALRPIPEPELNSLLNREEFGQNPGYGGVQAEQ